MGEITTLSHVYMAPLPQLRGFAINRLDKMRMSNGGDQKQLHLLFAKLGRISTESPEPFHRALQRQLVPNDKIFLTSYTLVVGPHAADSTNG